MAMQDWEYKTLICSSKLDTYLNALAKEGWELAAAPTVLLSGELLFVFKRGC